MKLRAARSSNWHEGAAKVEESTDGHVYLSGHYSTPTDRGQRTMRRRLQFHLTRGEARDLGADLLRASHQFEGLEKQLTVVTRTISVYPGTPDRATIDAALERLGRAVEYIAPRPSPCDGAVLVEVAPKMSKVVQCDNAVLGHKSHCTANYMWRAEAQRERRMHARWYREKGRLITLEVRENA